jgi:peptidoglycan/LPS O-acetylase OafA/YrhL
VMWVVIEITHLVPFTGGAWWLLPSTLMGATAVASLSWRFVESPFSRLRNRGPGRT